MAKKVGLTIIIKIMKEQTPAIFELPQKIDYLAEIKKEIEVKPERIEALLNSSQPGLFYRGVKAEDAFLSVFGKLKLNAHPEGEVIGARDNATINMSEAVQFSRTSQTKANRKFLCAIGFDPLPNALIEKSCLGRATQFRVTGDVAATEVVVRFAGKEPGKPGKAILMSPQKFAKWYLKNIG
jgi:hypothetical protein